MSATRMSDCSKPQAVLYMAFELGEVKWTLGFTTGLRQKPRRRDVPARATFIVEQEIRKAKERTCTSVCCGSSSGCRWSTGRFAS